MKGKMKRRIAFVALLSTAAMGAVALAVTQPPVSGIAPHLTLAYADAAGRPGAAARLAARPSRRAPLMGPRRLAAYLDLDEAQRASARQLIQQQRASMHPLHERQRALRDQLEARLADPKVDSAAVGRLVQQLHANRRQREAAREQLRGRLASLLDAEQQAKLQRLRSVVDDLRAPRRGRRSPGRG